MEFKTIVIDPPWKYDSPGWLGGTNRHYDTLPYEALKEIPIPKLTGEDAHLWVWTTDQHQDQALQLIKDWGFERKGTWIWLKLTKNPLSQKQLEAYEEKEVCTINYNGQIHGPSWSNGYYGRSCVEFLYLAVKGKNLTNHEARQTRKVLFGSLGEHSQKPTEADQFIKKYSPEDRLDIFSTVRKEGFTSWGREFKGIPLMDEWGQWAKENFQCVKSGIESTSEMTETAEISTE
jgi:N6-adenosine-specific RNA methylase IME4